MRICFLAPTATLDFYQSFKFLLIWKTKTISPCCFHFYFPNCEVECFFICLFTICISFSVNCLLQEQWFSHLTIHQNHAEGLKHDCPTPEFLIQWVWGGACECAFLRCSQVMLMLLVWGPDFKIIKLEKLPGPCTSLLFSLNPGCTLESSGKLYKSPGSWVPLQTT